MRVDQDEAKAVKEMELLMVAKTHSIVEKIKELQCKLAVLKGLDVSAPISLQLETTHQEIVDLKPRLDTIYKKYDDAENEIRRYIPQIQGIEGAVSELGSPSMQRIKS